MNESPTVLHIHRCGICNLSAPWCCRHRWTIGYIAVIVTAELALIVRGLF